MESALRRAFTLVEILAVIGIIATLIAILLPVLQQARNRSKAAVCASNLQQIGKAIALYAADHDDMIPYAPAPLSKKLVMEGRSVFGTKIDREVRKLPDVRQPLQAYAVSQRLWECPMDRIDAALRDEGGHADTWFAESGSSYDYDDDHALLGRTLSGYPYPSQNILCADLGGFHGGEGVTSMSNMLFADLHVKAATGSVAVESSQLDP